MNQGIDYGLGQTNVDRTTGIRYGVISQHSLGDSWLEDARPDYGDPTCPLCGVTVAPDNDCDEDYPAYKPHGCADYVCHACKHTIDSEWVFGDEPIGYFYQDYKYTLESCLDSDVMVLKSPYYTYAQFCSPCVPGAGNLNSPMTDGIKTYCLGPEWFDGGKAPYPIYLVSQ